jgi:transcription antitermination factor NusG
MESVMGFNICSSCEPKPGWWALYTKHQHEKKVAEVLTLKGAEVFLPLYGTLHRWNDRSVKISLPLFPSYVFVREAPEQRLAILTVPGVFLIVTSGGGGFGLIPDAEIQNLRKAVEDPRGIQPQGHPAVGNRVRITSGPLADVEGVLVRRKNQCRVVISIALLAQSASVEVNEWEIEPTLSSSKDRVVQIAAQRPIGGIASRAWT